MKFLRPLLGIAKLDKEKNQSIRKKKWGTEHSKGNETVPAKVVTTVQRVGTDRLSQQALRYRPEGRRNLGRPRKRWTDQIHLED
jgi:hypothetical protein